MIEATGLRVRYGAVEAVRGVSFAVRPGEICGLLGPNGAGKTSVVKVLCGILVPETGAAAIAGFDVASQRLEAQRRLGLVPESAAFYPILTAAEHLELVGELYELPLEGLAQKRAELLARFDLEAVSHRPIGTLSKGQRQRLALLSALLHEPEVLILDEPLSGLDAHAVRGVKTLLQRLAKDGRAILFCSHYLEVVERLCGRVVVLHEGRVVADSPTAELFSATRGETLESAFTQLTATRSTAPGGELDLESESG